AMPLAPPGTPGRDLLRRFRQVGRELDHAYERISEAARRQEMLGPDAEWLLGNYHIVSENMREVRHDLPRGYYRKLPKLAGGPFAGLPRVYALGLELIAHTDSALNETMITRVVQAYQQVAPLTIGELWAVPIMLRLGLLENLRRLACQVLRAWDDRCEAGNWLQHVLAVAEHTVEQADAYLAHPSRRPRCDWSDPFVIHLMQLLRDHGPDARGGMTWLERHLATRDADAVEVLHREHRRQAANQVSVGNCVTSLRLMAALDWKVFFEHTSLVEAELQED